MLGGEDWQKIQEALLSGPVTTSNPSEGFEPKVREDGGGNPLEFEFHFQCFLATGEKRRVGMTVIADGLRGLIAALSSKLRWRRLLRHAANFLSPATHVSLTLMSAIASGPTL